MYQNNKWVNVTAMGDFMRKFGTAPPLVLSLLFRSNLEAVIDVVGRGSGPRDFYMVSLLPSRTTPFE